jgi:hypothetical protein
VCGARQALDRSRDDEEARGDEKRSLGERTQVLGFAVPVRMAPVRRSDGDADGEERQQRGKFRNGSPRI